MVGMGQRNGIAQKILYRCILPCWGLFCAAVQKKVSRGHPRRRKNANNPTLETSTDRAGQRSYIPGIGHIQLTAVEEVELDRLTDADARPDGFATADQLRAEIARLYPQQLAEGYRAYRIAFVIAPKDSATSG